MESTTKETLFVINEVLGFSHDVLASTFSQADSKAFAGEVIWSVPLEGISREAILTAVNELNLWFNGVKFIADGESAMIVVGEQFDFDRNAAFLLPAATKEGCTEP